MLFPANFRVSSPLEHLKIAAKASDKETKKYSISRFRRFILSLTTFSHFFQIPKLKEIPGMIDDFMIVIYVSLSVEILGFLASCLSFASSCTDYGEASKRRGFVMPWVIWCFIGVAFNIGCVVYIYTALHSEINLGSITFRIYASTVWLVFCAIVGISYIKNMKDGYLPEQHPRIMMASDLGFQGNPPPYYKM